MADSPAKIAPPPPRDPLPPIYPIALIEVACRALELTGKLTSPEPNTTLRIKQIAATAMRIVEDGLASHELAAKEGRSRG